MKKLQKKYLYIFTKGGKQKKEKKKKKIYTYPSRYQRKEKIKKKLTMPLFCVPLEKLKFVWL